MIEASSAATHGLAVLVWAPFLGFGVLAGLWLALLIALQRRPPPRASRRVEAHPSPAPAPRLGVTARAANDLGQRLRVA